MVLRSICSSVNNLFPVSNNLIVINVLASNFKLLFFGFGTTVTAKFHEMIDFYIFVHLKGFLVSFLCYLTKIVDPIGCEILRSQTLHIDISQLILIYI